jgi:hypothetical protein
VPWNTVYLERAAEDGVLAFKVLEARTPEGAPLDPHIVDMLIHYLAARQPERYDISRPIPLPFFLAAPRLDAGTPRCPARRNHFVCVRAGSTEVN